MDYKSILTYVASALAIISVLPYLWNIYKGNTKPHAFSWFVWGLLTGIAFFAQIKSGAGIASMVIGITSFTNFSIAAIGFYQAHVKYTKFDWYSLSGAILAIVAWQLTSNPLYAVILVSISDIIGYLPTYRKGYYFPHEETASAFTIGAVYFILSIIALKNYSVTNWLYPAVICTTIIIFVSLLIIRRRQLNK